MSDTGFGVRLCDIVPMGAREPHGFVGCHPERRPILNLGADVVVELMTVTAAPGEPDIDLETTAGYLRCELSVLGIHTLFASN